ncbi:tRNA uracil 4-sulfurtransferase ThiI [Amphibacillus indicireducens]|uniref:Probable tRNA sulfurtransferase n=1 Tax=Amphibacillus indicireducens TaxID=1076330 RepID=A0ABP7VR54_9BACI
MLYDHIILKYGEISLKKKNRKDFIKQLRRNVKRQLSQFSNLEVESSREWMMIKLNGEDPNQIIPICQRIFGIQNMSVAVKVDNDLDSIKQAALFALQEADNVKTFKVSVRRANKEFPYNSPEMNQIIGGHLLSNTDNVTVDVHNPDLNVNINIRDNFSYITSKRYPGVGGLPVGSSGSTLLQLSGGIDSPVAGYLAMSRGLRIEAIHFHSPPYTSDGAKQKVIDLTRKLAEHGHDIKIHVIPFTAMQQKIHREIPFGYSMTVMRRMMLRISEIVALNRGILSITNGESLGQVASQTLESMHAINSVTNFPILRPLITMDKQEIIKIAQEVDTYPISIRPFDDCCTVFVPSSPKTKPRKDKVEYYESQLDLTKELEELLANIEVIHVSAKSKANDPLNDLF